MPLLVDDTDIRLLTKIGLFPILKINLISPMTSGFPATLGSMIKLFPLSLFGGNVPVVINFKH